MNGRYERRRVGGPKTKAGKVVGTAGCDVGDDGLEGRVAAWAQATEAGQPSVDRGDDRGGV